MLQASDKALDLLKQFEGFSAKPYLDVVGVPTIGYGTTFYPDGRRVSMQDKECTKDSAHECLYSALDSFVSDLNGLLKVEVAQHQFDALVSLVYNIGINAFKNSTLLRKLNNKDFAGAAAEFPRWNKAGGKPVAGLTKRRLKEQEMFVGTNSTNTGRVC